VTQVTCQNCESSYAAFCRVNGELNAAGIHMSKIALLVAAAALLGLISVDTWVSIKTLTPGELAGSTFNRLTITTAAKGQLTSNYSDYLFVSP
jgi:hypothetical protein